MIDPLHFDRLDHDDVVDKWYVCVGDGVGLSQPFIESTVI